MDLTREAIEKFEELVDAGRGDFVKAPSGRWYRTGGEVHALPRAPLATALGTSTLESLALYLTANRDRVDLARAVVLVADETKVSLLGPLNGDDRQRETLFVASALLPPHAHKWGEFVELDDFLVWLGTGFVVDESTRALVALLSHVDTTDGAEIRDDGLTQTVTTRTGVATRGRVEVPNPVKLRPFSTFPEVEQPERSFLLRLRHRKDALPLAKLVPTGEGLWRLDTRERIARWLLDSFAEGEPRIGVPVLY